MTYKTLQEVPAEIRDYFYEETVKEPVMDEDGNAVLVQESFTYVDENGDTQTGYKMVPKLEDVTYVLEKEPEDLKAWDDVDFVIEHHKGNNDTVVRYFVAKAIEYDNYEWFISYKEWLDLPVVDEEGAPITKPSAPVKPVMDTTDKWFVANYRKLREAAYPSMIEQMEMRYSAEADGTVWKDVITKVHTQYPAK